MRCSARVHKAVVCVVAGFGSFAEFLRLDLGKNIFCGFIEGPSLDVEHANTPHVTFERAVLVCACRVQSAPLMKYDVYMKKSMLVYELVVVARSKKCFKNCIRAKKRQREDHCKFWGSVARRNGDGQRSARGALARDVGRCSFRRSTCRRCSHCRSRACLQSQGGRRHTRLQHRKRKHQHDHTSQ